MRKENSYMVRPRSALSMEKLTLDTPSLSAFEKTLVSAGTTSDLAATHHLFHRLTGQWKFTRDVNGLAWHGMMFCGAET